MALCLESGYTSLNKKNEELCGDRVESIVSGDYTTLVLADGLGSGVKANILSTLTSKILCTMVSNDIDIEECVETIIQSLPVCKVRGVAYSTFSVIHMNREAGGISSNSTIRRRSSCAIRSAAICPARGWIFSARRSINRRSI